jgi:hypothetical protein
MILAHAGQTKNIKNAVVSNFKSYVLEQEEKK